MGLAHGEVEGIRPLAADERWCQGKTDLFTPLQTRGHASVEDVEDWVAGSALTVVVTGCTPCPGKSLMRGTD